LVNVSVAFGEAGVFFKAIFLEGREKLVFMFALVVALALAAPT